MMDFLDVVMRLLGVFYALGAFVGVRSLAMSALIDRAIGMIGMQPEAPKVVARRWLLGAVTVLTGVAGVALALASAWALPLFAANLVLQVAWLGWAWQAFPPQDAEETAGRRRTRNAALGWAVVTAAVAWMWLEGRLSPRQDLVAAVVVLAAAAGYAGWLVRCLRWKPAEGAHLSPPKRIRRLRVSMLSEDALLSDADTGEGLSVYSCLPTPLAERFDAWDDALFDAGGRDGPDARPTFPTPEAAAEHWREGMAIAAAMEAHFGRGNVEWLPGGPPGYPRPDGA